MKTSEKPEDIVLCRMIREVERAYEKLDAPKCHRVTMGNDPKRAGLDCSEFQPTERTKMENFCFHKYLQEKDAEAKQRFDEYPHCIYPKNERQ